MGIVRRVTIVASLVLSSGLDLASAQTRTGCTIGGVLACEDPRTSVELMAYRDEVVERLLPVLVESGACIVIPGRTEIMVTVREIPPRPPHVTVSIFGMNSGGIAPGPRRILRGLDIPEHMRGLWWTPWEGVKLRDWRGEPAEVNSCEERKR